MHRYNTLHLSGSVGREGVNRRHDVIAVQELLNLHLPTPLRTLRVDGVAGPRTIEVITESQRRYLHMQQPDGRIDPHGPTLRVLNAAERVLPPAPPRQTSPAMPAAARRPATPPPHAARQPAARPHPAKTSGGRVPPADVIAAARHSQQTWGIPASISIAQWAIESGWGKHMPPGSNNPFGIKARKNDRAVLAWTTEVINHQKVRVRARFRVFTSMTEAFDLHGKLVATGRPYANARKHLNDPDAFANALTGVYATDERYGEKLRDEMRADNLYQYD